MNSPIFFFRLFPFSICGATPASNPTAALSCQPFVYGSAAFALGKNQTDENSHRWYVYVRGLENEDMSHFIREVHFYLHEDFKDPIRGAYRLCWKASLVFLFPSYSVVVRVTLDLFRFQPSPSIAMLAPVCKKAPYEVEEKGWGEFPIKIKVFFRDAEEEDKCSSLELTHMLKLFPENRSSSAQNPKKPVMSEKYDEFVFVNPSDKFFARLMTKPAQHFDSHPLSSFCTYFSCELQRFLLDFCSFAPAGTASSTLALVTSRLLYASALAGSLPYLPLFLVGAARTDTTATMIEQEQKHLTKISNAHQQVKQKIEQLRYDTFTITRYGAFRSFFCYFALFEATLPFRSSSGDWTCTLTSFVRSCIENHRAKLYETESEIHMLTATREQ